MTRTGVILIFMFGAIATSVAGAQGPLAPGTHVRFIPAGPDDVARRGRVVRDSIESAIVRYEADPIHGFERSIENVPHTRLERRTSVRRRTVPGAWIGAIAGGFTGARIGANEPGQLCEGSPTAGFTCRHDNSLVGPLLIIGGVGGAGIGALVGLLIKTERWERVPHTSAYQLAPIAGPRTFGIALHLNLR